MSQRLNWPMTAIILASIGACSYLWARHVDVPAWAVLLLTTSLGLAPSAVNGAKPPAGPLAILALMLSAGALTACAGATPGLPTQADFAAYSWAQASCIQSQDTKAATLVCLADTRRAFCSQFSAVCPTEDGGAQ